MKIAVGMIVLNSNFLLFQAIDSIYEFAHAICIAEGPVQWWVDHGVEMSDNDTIQTLHCYPDIANKIKIVHGQYKEKTEQCQAWFNLVPPDTDYILCVDADEIHSAQNLEKLIRFLEKEQPTSVGFKSDTFYGGFERIMGGFERDHSFKRVLKYQPGCYYRTHRQPTLATGDHDIAGKDITGNQFYEATGVTMWHGSYISPKGVAEKISYYEGAVISPGKCIPDYVSNIFLQWLIYPDRRPEIESWNKGVHEFVPEIRGESYTIPFTGKHPDIIIRDMPALQKQFENEVAWLLEHY
jgi:hypothetical protein